MALPLLRMCHHHYAAVKTGRMQQSVGTRGERLGWHQRARKIHAIKIQRVRGSMIALNIWDLKSEGFWETIGQNKQVKQ